MTFQFGGAQGKTGFACQLDEVRIYNRKLSDDEIGKVKTYTPD